MGLFFAEMHQRLGEFRIESLELEHPIKLTTLRFGLLPLRIGSKTAKLGHSWIENRDYIFLYINWVIANWYSFLKTFKTTNGHSFWSHDPFFIILTPFESQFKILFTNITIEESIENQGNSHNLVLSRVQDQSHNRHWNHRARCNLFS